MTQTETSAKLARARAVRGGRDQERLRPALGFGLGVGALVLATWLYAGYRYEVWPQPNFLTYVLRYSGVLENDWFTSATPPHWAVDNLLALVPHGRLDEAVLGLWLVFLAVLWGGFLSICRSLGAPIYAGVAAGLVLILTRVGGFGASDVLFEFFYPNTLSFAIAVAAIAFILRRRYSLAGAALGLSVVAHPGVGPLAVGAIAPAALFAEGRPTRARLLRFGIPLVVIAAPPALQLLGSQLAGGTLTTQERLDFLATIRGPHHLLYSAFPAVEYTRTFLWAGVLAVALVMLRRVPEARPIRWIAGTIVLACAAGAIAGEMGWLLMLVTAQTSRLSALVVLLAAAAAAAALSRIDARVATVALAGTFLLAPLFQTKLFAEPGRLISYMSISAVAAGLVLALLVAAAVLGARGRPRVSGALPAALAAVALAVAGVSLAVERADRAPQETPAALAFEDVAHQAQGATRSGELVLSPPDQDGFSMLAERPNVVEFGLSRLEEGEGEWRRRLVDVTGNPAVLERDPLGTDVAARVQLIADSYDRNIASSKAPICRYRPVLVVTRSTAPLPAWLDDIYFNGPYVLSRVKPGTCD